MSRWLLKPTNTLTLCWEDPIYLLAYEYHSLPSCDNIAKENNLKEGVFYFNSFRVFGLCHLGPCFFAHVWQKHGSPLLWQRSLFTFDNKKQWEKRKLRTWYNIPRTHSSWVLSSSSVPPLEVPRTSQHSASGIKLSTPEPVIAIPRWTTASTHDIREVANWVLKPPAGLRFYVSVWKYERILEYLK